MSHDLTGTSIPASDRRSPLTLGLVWLTMVTFFPCVLAGFAWFKEGISLPQALVCSLVSCLLLMFYTVPICLIAARTGLGYAEMNKRTFGASASFFININVIWIFTAWYGLSGVLLAEGLNGLFHLDLPLTWFSAALAVIMAVNNFFGFKGIANFARFFAAPVLIGWVAYCAAKALPTCPVSVLTEPAHTSWAQALTVVSGFVIGTAVWGNEADYWRYGKAKISFSVWPLAVALCIGQVLFPLTGWLVSRSTGITDNAQATSFMNDYSFAGVAAIGALILVASYFAATDSNLFGSTQTLRSLTGLSKRTCVAVLTALAAATAACLAHSGGARALESIAALNCIILPTPTVLVVAEYFINRNRLDERHQTNWPAIIAAVAATAVGLLTSGIFPSLAALHVGICPLQSWLTALAVYVPLRLVLAQPLLVPGNRHQEELAPISIKTTDC